jgi:hypothetical protein
MQPRAAGFDPQQMAKLGMSLMSSGQQAQQAPQMQPMQQMQPTMNSQQATQFLQQYAPMGGVQQQNDEMMRQRMQGLMAMLGGQ